MKIVTTFVLLVLVTSLMFGGLTSSAQAQIDPYILLKIASKAKLQVESQLSKMDSVSSTANQLFRQASSEVRLIEEALENDDISSARLHFLTAMKTFKKITIMTSDDKTERAELAATSIKRKPTNDLDRLEKYVGSLKEIASKHNVDVDFSEIDRLLENARAQIREDKLDEVYDTIHQLKRLGIEIQHKIRELTNQTTTDRATNYVQRYLHFVDQLIETANEKGSSQELIDKLNQAKENLSNATDRGQIIKEIRNIILLKHQIAQ